MRLASRTALAAFAAASVTLLLTGAVLRGRFAEVIEDRVDAQLEDRAESAPILAAIAERLARSELVGTVDASRVLVHGEIVELGDLPEDPLPLPSEPGFVTVRADGQRWRLHTISVEDVPEMGDRTLVQLAEPLGDVDDEIRQLRRRLVVAGLLVSIAAGLVGWLLGGFAARPLTTLRRDAATLRDDDPATWKVGDRYGSPDVDDVARALNVNLERLAEETIRRDRALDAARAFAASASHELRTPLQSALTNLEIARSDRAEEAVRAEAVALAHQQVQRMGGSLAAVRALADAEFADPAWFEPLDLVEVAEAAVADERRRAHDATIDVVTSSTGGPVPAWREGVQLAIANVVRNALIHGRGPDGTAEIVVTVDASTVTVTDAGPGIPAGDRERLVERFAKGAGSGGSGLGLAIAREVAVAHGGGIAVAQGPRGGASVTLRFGA